MPWVRRPLKQKKREAREEGIKGRRRECKEPMKGRLGDREKYNAFTWTAAAPWFGVLKVLPSLYRNVIFEISFFLLICYNIGKKESHGRNPSLRSTLRSGCFKLHAFFARCASRLRRLSFPREKESRNHRSWKLDELHASYFYCMEKRIDRWNKIALNKLLNINLRYVRK